MATSSESVAQSTRQVGKMTLSLPSDREIVLTRTFDAPRRLVWEAYTRPEHLARWLGPRRYEIDALDMDLRPGGRWRFVHRTPDGGAHAFRGQFLEVEPPTRLVRTFEYEAFPGHVSVETAVFEEHDGKTTITVTSRFDSVEDRDGMLQSGMENGAAESWDRLAELLAELQADGA